MPADRARRDAAADALASYLRGAIGRDAIEEVFKRLDQASEAKCEAKTEKDTYLEGLLASWYILDGRHRPVSEEMWSALSRHLAFLKTDLEEKRWHDHEDEDRPRQILLARWHTLGLLVASGVAYLTNWWLFAAATLISFLLYQVSIRKHDLLNDEERKKTMRRQQEFFPFADQAEWLAHKHVTDEYHLPAYDPGAFGEPPPVRKWPAFVATPLRWICYLLAVAMFSYMYLFSVVIWPVWLVMMSLCSREGSRG